MSFWKWQPLSEYEEEHVTKSIAEAEKNTAGEIRVHIDRWCKTNPIYKAQNIFNHLKMYDTAQRNGVLIYVAKEEHKFAIVGDIGIHRLVGDQFWNSTKEKMLTHFQKEDLVNGLIAGIEEVGLQLKQHFPYQEDDENELPNTISYEE